MNNCADDVEEDFEEESPLDPRLRLSLRWRWPSLDTDHLTSASLRPLPTCHQHILGRHHYPHYQHDYHSLCINPYHWALLIATTTAGKCVSSLPKAIPTLPEIPKLKGWKDDAAAVAFSVRAPSTTATTTTIP